LGLLDPLNDLVGISSGPRAMRMVGWAHCTFFINFGPLWLGFNQLDAGSAPIVYKRSRE
jgi:hypothetical protein